MKCYVILYHYGICLNFCYGVCHESCYVIERIGVACQSAVGNKVVTI